MVSVLRLLKRDNVGLNAQGVKAACISLSVTECNAFNDNVECLCSPVILWLNL